MMKSDLEVCKQQLKASKSSFYYSLFFLKKEKRNAMTALYAFCRTIDDIVDEMREPSVAAMKLSWWRQEVFKMYDGEATHPIARCLAMFVQQYKMPREYFLAMLDGMEMDLNNYVYHSWQDLEQYCYNVASTVGLLSCYIFGFNNSDTLNYAKKLGIGLQLVNIIRDVGEDLRRSRVYFAEEDLAQFSLEREDILYKNKEDKIKLLLEFYAKRARQYYQEALSILPKEDRKQQRAALIMAKTYFANLALIEESDFQVLDHKILISAGYKLKIALKTFVYEYFTTCTS